MKITKDTTIDVLMHGDNIDYIDLDEDEIVHFKYIKREKLPNGKWRYYYDTDQLKSDVQKLKTNAKQKFEDAIGITAAKEFNKAYDSYYHIDEKRNTNVNYLNRKYGEYKGKLNTAERELRALKTTNNKIDSAKINKRRKELERQISDLESKMEANDRAVYSSSRTYLDARKKLNRALSAYKNTPIYKLQKRSAKISRWLYRTYGIF